MNENIDYLFSSNPSNVDETETPSSPEPNWSDPCSPRLSDAINFSNSDIVCISSDESAEPHCQRRNSLLPTCQKQGLQHSLTIPVDTNPAEAPAPMKDDIVEWIIRAHTTLALQPQCVAKSFKVCGTSNNLDGSENALIHCVKELPALTILYGNTNSDKDIFISDSDSSSDTDDSEDEED